MPSKKQIQISEKVPLKLTAAERKRILEDVTCLDRDCEQTIRDTPSGKPVMMTLDELNDVCGYLAAEANHCDYRKKQKKLDSVFEKIQHLLDTYTDEGLPETLKVEDRGKEEEMSDQAVQIAEFAAQALVAAEQLRIKTKPLDNFWLAPAQREILLLIPGLSKTIKNKLAKEKPLSVAEVASMTLAVAEDLPNNEPKRKVALLLVTKHLMDRLQEGIKEKAEPPAKKKLKRATPKKSDVLYQFKVTLLESKPLIWRRIQIKDCTLEKLHEHIQTVMGWTNSHLHQFEINGESYGDPELIDDGFEDFHCIDSTVTKISEIVPKDGKRCQFTYEYDFGDDWQHEVLFEGCLQAETGIRYPVCVEGERNCPPEDVGGVWGYGEYLEALADPKHERHEEFVEWAGDFDPEKFDAGKTTRVMQRGLPDWRQYR